MLSRDETIQIGTYNPGFAENVKPFNLNHRSLGTLSQLPVKLEGGVSGREIHHVMGIQDHLRPLVQGLPEHQQQAIMHRLLAKGVVFGQNPDNLIALNYDDHKATHRHMEDIGLDSNLEADKLRVLNAISNLPFKERLIAADVFAEQIYPGIIEAMHNLGHKVPTQQDNIKKYKQSIKEEKLKEIKRQHIEDMGVKFGTSPTIGNVRKIRDYSLPIAGAASPNYLRMAGDAIRQLIGRDASELTTGDISGDKPIVVNADEGANVFVHTNGKNGNGYGKTQQKLNDTLKRMR